MSGVVSGYFVGTFAGAALNPEDERPHLMVAVDPGGAQAITRCAEAFRGDGGEPPLTLVLFAEPPAGGMSPHRLMTAVDAAFTFVEAMQGAGLLAPIADQLQRRFEHLAEANREAAVARGYQRPDPRP